MGLIAQLLQKRSPVVHIVSPHQTVAEAVAIMAARKVGAVPVVEDGRLVGIFSERDVRAPRGLGEPLRPRRPRSARS